MWNSLIWGIAGLIGPTAPLPQVQELRDVTPVFAEHFELDTDRIRVTLIEKDHASPLLTRGGGKYCLVHVNQDSSARALWNYMVQHENPEFQSAFTSFAMGHELTHCLLGQAGVRMRYKPLVEAALGQGFTDNQHFEESLGDLLGLYHVAQTHPALANDILKRLKQVRMDFSSRDKQHDSSAFLDMGTVDKVAKLLMKTQPPTNVALSSKPQP